MSDTWGNDDFDIESYTLPYPVVFCLVFWNHVQNLSGDILAVLPQYA